MLHASSLVANPINIFIAKVSKLVIKKRFKKEIFYAILQQNAVLGSSKWLRPPRRDKERNQSFPGFTLLCFIIYAFAVLYFVLLRFTFYLFVFCS